MGATGPQCRGLYYVLFLTFTFFCISAPSTNPIYLYYAVTAPSTNPIYLCYTVSVPSPNPIYLYYAITTPSNAFLPIDAKI